MKRIFIAVDISDEARRKAAAYMDTLRRAFPMLRVGWERPEKLHLTLKFLGDVNEDRLNEVQNAVREIAGKNDLFRMTLGGTGRFPLKGDPRILWLGATDEGQAAVMASRIDSRLSTLGFEPQKRGFTPHLTIARLREPRLSEALATRHVGNEFEPVGFEVGEIVIYESKLLPRGSIYTQMAAFPLMTSR